ncbi:GFA family protein [Undibacterium sp. TS12]|uniref:GFA family protein n=1 Tax=Undibacterium sp. TS12 TaxID=2908202 RepID=UPI001F4D228F|nr:GFA family protein [Undibacterium sp. TS12]MCH8622220.1 GFA family protein [Undibacterium sp. TS12]
MKTCQGSCHCKAIRFEADINLADGSMRCNCSFCLKVRCWSTPVKPEFFRLLAGEADLAEYRFGAGNEQHFFCRHCGVRPFGITHSPRRGKFYGVSVNCLDEIDIAALANVPVTYVDGVNDNWDTPPDEVAYL